MERKMMLLLFAVLFVTSANTNPLPKSDDESCWSPCPSSTSEVQRLGFERGKTMTFSYVTDTVTSTMATDADQSGLRLQMSAHVDGLSHCQARLRLSDVSVSHWDTQSKSFQDVPSSDNYKSLLEAQDLVFTYRDGQVQRVCKHRSDSEWAANIKRGFLSALQLPLDQTQSTVEKSISGECPIRVNSESSNKWTKTFEMEKCVGHSHGRSALQSAFYRTPRDSPQTLPLTDMSSTCTYTVKEVKGGIQQVHCQETHFLRPFRNGDNGARTATNQRVSLQQHRATGINKISFEEHYTPSRLAYVPPSTAELARTRQANTDDVLQLLLHMARTSATDARPETPQLFTELVYKMRLLNGDQLQSVQRALQSDNKFKTIQKRIMGFFYDAVALLNTEAGFKTMMGLVQRSEISEEEVTLWLASLSFLQEAPTKKMIESVKPLLEMAQVRDRALFPVSTLVNRYCHQVGLHVCKTEADIVDLVRILITRLNNDCHIATGQTKTQVLTVLKSLGNVGFDLAEMSSTLHRCAHRRDSMVAVRVAAIQALQRLDCSTDRSPLFTLLEDTELDTEIRIHAYLAVMRCPSIEVINKIKNILEKEKVNQVGSFIWTHLTNLRETDDPLKKEIREILQTTSLKQEFDLDKLKFSRNFEKSFFSEQWNVGGQVESNLIWSQDSFLPRSLSMNLTADLFGAAINFMEVEGRVEGAEKIMEQILGPKGLVKKGVTPASNPMAYLSALKELDGSLSVRMFGRDILFLNAAGQKDSSNLLLSTLTKGSKIDLQKNLILVESSLEMGTANGMPLKLSVNVSSSVDVQYTSKFQLPRRVENHIEPSGALLVSAHMALGSPFGDYGLKLVTTLHSSSHMLTSLLLDDNNGLRVEFDMPKEKQEIISFKSNVFSVHRNVELDQSSVEAPQTSRSLCTGSTVENILGLEVCAIVSYPRSFSLRGPMSAHVTVLKRDTQRGYLFALKSSRRDYFNRHYRWELDTPGSKVNRHFLAEFEMDLEQPKLNIVWKDPWRSASLLMFMNSSQASSKLIVNNKELFALEERLTTSSSEGQQKFEVELRAPIFLGPKSIKGVYETIVSAQEISGKAELTGLFSVPLKAAIRASTVQTLNKASLVKKMNVQGDYSSSFARGDLSGTMEYNSFSHKVDLKVKHVKVRVTGPSRIEDVGTPQMVALRHKWQGSGTSSPRMRHDVNTRISFGTTGEKFVGIILETEFSQRHANMKASLDCDLPRFGKHQISSTVHTGFVMKSRGDHVIQLVAELLYPQREWNYNGKFISKLEALEYQGNMEMKASGKNLVSADIKWTNKQTRVLDAEMLGTVEILGRKVSVKNTLREVVLRRFENDFTAEWGGQALKMQSVYHAPNRRTHKFSHSMQGPHLQDGIKADFILDFETLAKATFKVALDVVKTEYQYGIESNLRYQPGKEGAFRGLLPAVEWLELSNRVWMPEVNATDIIQMAFTPKHILTSLQSQWNKMELLNLHAELKHDDSIPRKFVDLITLRLHYPGRKSSIQLHSDFQYLKFTGQLDVVLQEDKKISFTTMYDINDGWTEKGITASATLTTPYPGYERTHLGLYGLGQLRYRKVAVEYHWGKGKRVVVELVVQPKSTHDFTSTFRIITPFTRMSYLGLHLKHFYSGKQYVSETRLDLGPSKQYGISLNYINNGDHRVRDLQAELKLSAYRLIQDVSVKFVHRDDGKNFKSELMTDWGASAPLKVVSVVDLLLEGYSVKTRGSVVLSTPWRNMKSLNVDWNQMTTDTSMNTALKVVHNSQTLLEGSVKGGFSFTMPIKVNLNFNFNAWNSERLTGSYELTGDETFAKSETRVSYNDEEYYNDRFTSANRDGQLKYDIFMNSLLLPWKSSHFKAEFTNKVPTLGLTSSLVYGDEEVKVFEIDATATVERERVNVKVTGESDLTGPNYKRLTLSHKVDLFQGKYHVSMKCQVNEQDLITYDATVELNQKLYINYRLNTRFPQVQSVELTVNHVGSLSQFTTTYNIALNGRHHLEGEVNSRGRRDVTAKMQINSPLLRKNMEFTHAIQSDGLKQKLSMMDLFDNSRIEYNVQLSEMGRSEIRITTPFLTVCKELLLVRQKDRHECRLELTHSTNTATNTLAVQTTNRAGTLKQEITYKLGSYQGDAMFQMQQNPISQKWEVRANTNLQGRRGELLVTMGSLRFRDFSIMLKTPFKVLSQLSMHFKLVGKWDDFYHSHSFKAVINGKKINFENVLGHVGYSFVEVASRHDCDYDSRFNYLVKYIHRFSPSKSFLQVNVEHRSLGKNELILEKPVGQSLSVRLVTPFKYVREVAFTHHFSSSRNWSEMKHNTGVKYRLDDQIFVANGTLEWTQLNYVNVHFNLQLPNKKFNNSEVQFTHFLSRDTLRETVKLCNKEINLVWSPEKVEVAWLKKGERRVQFLMLRSKSRTLQKFSIFLHRDLLGKVNRLLGFAGKPIHSAEFKLDVSEGNSFKVDMVLPGFIIANSTAKYSFKSWRDFSGKVTLKMDQSESTLEYRLQNSQLAVELRTPFQFIHDLSLKGNYQRDVKSLKMQYNSTPLLQFHWEPSREVFIGLKKCEFLLSHENFPIHLQVDGTQNSLQASLSSVWTDKVELKLEAPDSDTVKADFSLPVVDNLRISMATQKSTGFKHQLRVKKDAWKKDLQMTLSLTSMRGFENTLTMDLVTPFKKWRQSKAYVNWKVSDRLNDVKLEGRFENSEVLSSAVEFNGVLKRESKDTSLIISYRAPIPGYESGELLLQTIGDKFTTKLSTKKNPEVFVLNAQLLDDGLVMTTTLKYLKELKLKSEKKSLQVTARGESWNSDMKVGKEELQFKLKTNEQNFRLVSGWNVKNWSRQFAFNLSIESDQPNVPARVVLLWDIREKVIVKVDSSIPFIPKANLQAFWSRPQKFELKVNVDHDVLASPIKVEVSHVAGLFKLNVNTPFSNYVRQFDAEVGYAMNRLQLKAVADGGISFNIQGSAGFEKKRFTKTITVKLTCNTFGTASGVAEWKVTEKGFVATITAETPIEGMERQKIVLENDMHTGKLIISQSQLPRDIVAQLALVEKDVLELKLETPFTHFQSQKVVLSVSLDSPFTGSPKRIEFNSEEHGQWRLVRTLNTKSSDSGFDLAYLLETPLNKMRKSSIRVEYKPVDKAHYLTVAFENNHLGEFKADSKLKLLGNRESELQVKVETPLMICRNVEASFSHKLSPSALKIAAKAVHNSNNVLDFDLKADYNSEPTLRLQMHLPMLPITLDVKATSSKLNKVEGTLHVNDMEIFSGSVSLESNNAMTVKFVVQEMPILSARISIPSLTRSNSEISVDLDLHKLGTISASWKHKNQNWKQGKEVHVNLVNKLLPALWKTSKFDFTVNSNSLRLSTKVDEIESLKIEGDWSSSKIDLRVFTPVEPFQDSRFYVELQPNNWSIQDVRAKMGLLVGYVNVELAGEVQRLQDGTTKLSLAIPNYEVQMKVKADLSPAAVVGHFSLDFNRKNIVAVDLDVQQRQQHYSVNLGLSQAGQAIFMTQLNLLLSWRHSFINGHVQFYDQRFETNMKSEWDAVKIGSLLFVSSKNAHRKVYQAGFVHRYVNLYEELLLESSLQVMDVSVGLKLMSNKRSRAQVKLTTPIKLLNGEVFGEYLTFKRNSQHGLNVTMNIVNELVTLKSHFGGIRNGPVEANVILQQGTKEIVKMEVKAQQHSTGFALKSSVNVFRQKADLQLKYFKDPTDGHTVELMARSSWYWLQTINMKTSLSYKKYFSVQTKTNFRAVFGANVVDISSAMETSPSQAFKIRVLHNDNVVLSGNGLLRIQDGSQVESEAMVAFLGSKYGYTLKGQFAPKLKGSLSVYLPVLRDGQLNVNYDHQQQGTSSSYKLTFGSDKDLADLRYQQDSQRVSFSVKSPFSFLEDGSLEVEGLQPDSPLMSVSMVLNNEPRPAFRVTMKRNKKPKTVSGKLSLESTLFPMLNGLDVEFNHEEVGPREWRFKHGVRHVTGKQLQVEGSTSFKENEAQFDSEFNSHLGNARLHLKHKNTGRDYMNELHFTTPHRNVYSSAFNFTRPSQDELLFQHQLHTPTHFWGNLDTSFHHQGPLHNHKHKLRVTRGKNVPALVSYEGECDWTKMRHRHQIEVPGWVTVVSDVKLKDAYVHTELHLHGSDRKHFVKLAPVEGKSGWRVTTTCPYLRSLELLAEMEAQRLSMDNLYTFLPSYSRLSLNDAHWLEMDRRDALRLRSSHPLLSHLEIKTENQPTSKGIRIQYGSESMNVRYLRQGSDRHSMEFTSTYPRAVSGKVELELKPDSGRARLQWQDKEMEVQAKNNRTTVEFSMSSTDKRLPTLTFSTTKSLTPLKTVLKWNEHQSTFQMDMKTTSSRVNFDVKLDGNLLPVKNIQAQMTMENALTGTNNIKVQVIYDQESLLTITHTCQRIESQGRKMKTLVKSSLLPGEIKVESTWIVRRWTARERDAEIFLAVNTPFPELNGAVLDVKVTKTLQRCFCTVKVQRNGNSIFASQMQVDENVANVQVTTSGWLDLEWSAGRDVDGEHVKLTMKNLAPGRPLAFEYRRRGGDARIHATSPFTKIQMLNITIITSTEVNRLEMSVNEREFLKADWAGELTRDSQRVYIKSFLPILFEFELSGKRDPRTLQMTHSKLLVNWSPMEPGQYVLLRFDRDGANIRVEMGHMQNTIQLEVGSSSIKITKIRSGQKPVSVELVVERNGKECSVTLNTPWRSLQLRSVKSSWSSSEAELTTELCLDTTRRSQTTFRLHTKLQFQNYKTFAKVRIFYPGRMDNPANLNFLHTVDSALRRTEMSLQLTEKLEEAILFSMETPATLETILSGQLWEAKFSAQRKSGDVAVAGQVGLNLKGRNPSFLMALQFKRPTETMRKYLLDVQMKQSATNDLLHVNVATPSTSFKTEVTFQYNQKPGHIITAVAEVDSQRVARAVLQLNSTAPAFSLKLHLDPENLEDFVQIEAGYHGDYEVKSLIATRTGSTNMVLLDVQVQLISERLLKSTFYWRSDLVERFGNGLRQLSRHIEQRLAKYRQSLSQTSFQFSTQLFSFQSQVPYSELKREMDSLAEDVKDLWRALSKAYWRDEFYMRSIVNCVGRALEEHILMARRLVRDVVYTLNVIQWSICRMCKDLLSIVYQSFTYVEHMLADLSARFIHGVARGIVRMCEGIVSLISRLSELQWWPSQEWLEDNLRPLAWLYHKIVVQLKEGVAATKYMLTFLPFEKQTREFVDWLLNTFESYMESFSLRLRNFGRSFTKAPMYWDYVRYFLTESIDITKGFLDNVYTIDALRDMLLDDYRLLANYVKKALLTSWNDALKLNKFYLLDSSTPDITNIQMQLYLPMTVKNLKTLPQMPPLNWRWDVPLRSRVWQTLSGHYFTLSTFGWNLPPLKFISGGRRSVWPSFTETATLTSNHVITFDKKHFTLDGATCDFVLVRGPDNAWEVSTERGRKTLVARLGKTVVKITENKQVLVNGVNTNTPIHVKSIRVLRHGRFVKLRDTDIGLTVIVDSEYGIFTVGVSRWHHAKLTGLFGNMDAEPFNDFLTKDTVRTENKHVFLQSWVTGSSCQTSRTEQIELMDDDAAFRQKLSCGFLFSCPLSPLATCFRHVDPRPFEQLCQEERSECGAGQTICPVKRICNAVQAYAAHCRHEKVSVRVPRVCHSCGENNDDSRVQLNPERAEVVFIVEDNKRCQNSRTVREMAASIKSVFHLRGVRDIKFAVVSYGQFIYTHTFNERIFVDDYELKKNSLDTIQFTENAAESMDGGQQAMLAVEYATHLPFHADSTKLMFMLPCSTCGAMKPELSNLVQRMGIHFTSVMRTRWIHDPVPSRRYYAMDQIAVYCTIRPMGTRQPLEKHHLSGEGCYELAMKSGGLVFDRQAEILMTQRPNFHKFLTQRLHSVHSTSRDATASSVLTCTCEPTHYFGSRKVCRRVPL